MRRPNRQVQLLGLLLLLAVFCRPGAGQSTTVRQLIYPVFNSPGVRLDAGRNLTLPFQLGLNLRRAQLTGEIQAQGAAGGEIRVFVYQGQRLVYDSGYRRSIFLNLPLLWPGPYVLVLSNAQGTPTTKVVWGNVNLLCEEVGVIQPEAGTKPAEEKKNLAAERSQEGQEILKRLYQSLQTIEREVGTRRVTVQPHLGFGSARESSGDSAEGGQAIWINRESFEVAEALGSQKSDALAGVLAHDLAHLYHGRGRSGHNSALWAELQGDLALDRKQEEEADRLGLRLACLAGFNPEGVSLWLRSAAERLEKAGSSHSEPGDRIAFLEQEARTCAGGRASGPALGQEMPGPDLSSTLPRRSIEDIFKSETETESEERPKPSRRETTPRSGAEAERGEPPKLLRRRPEAEAEPEPSPKSGPEGRPTLRHKPLEETARPAPDATQSEDRAGEATSETSAATGKAKASTAPLVVISKEQPEYTEEARRRGVKGTVVLSVVFTLDGQVTDIRVIKGLPDGLTEKAIEAAKRIRFEPAVRDGEPMSIRTKVEFEFKP